MGLQGGEGVGRSVADPQRTPEFLLEKIERAKGGRVTSEVGQRPVEEVEDSGNRSPWFRHQIGELRKIAAQKEIGAREAGRVERLENLNLTQGVKGGFFRGHQRDFADIEKVELARERAGWPPGSTGHGGNLPVPEGQPCDNPAGIAPGPPADQNGR